MATNQNSDTTKAIVEALRLSTANNDIIPSNIVNSIQPVIDVNPASNRRVNIVRNASSSATGSTTLYTTPANQDFFVTNLYFSFDKTAICDAALVYIGVTIDGALRSFSARTLTLTIEPGQVVSIEFPVPIKVDRNTAIVLVGDFGAGALTKSGTVVGYTTNS